MLGVQPGQEILKKHGQRNPVYFCQLFGDPFAISLFCVTSLCAMDYVVTALRPSFTFPCDPVGSQQACAAVVGRPCPLGWDRSRRHRHGLRVTLPLPLL